LDVELRERVAAFRKEKGRDPSEREMGMLRYLTILRGVGVVAGDAAWIESETNSPAISKEAWQSILTKGGREIRLLGKRAGGAVRTLQRFGMSGTGAFDQFMKIEIGEAEAVAMALRQAINEGNEGDAAADRATELLRDPASVAWARGSEEASRVTYNDPGGQFAKRAREIMHTPIGGEKVKTAEGKEQAVGGVTPQRWLVPFLTTGGNLAKQFFRHYPGTSWLNLLSKINTARRTGDWDKARLTPAIADAMIGWAGFLALAALRSEDPDKQWITGRRNSRHPYAIKLPGVGWVSYQYVQPFSSMIGATVDLLDAINTGSARTIASEPVVTIFEQIDTWPLFQGLSDIFKAISLGASAAWSRKAGDAERAGEQIVRWASNLAASFTSIPPGAQLVKQVARAGQGNRPDRREWAHGEDFLRLALVRTAQKTEFPQLLGFLPDEPRIDYLGRVVPKDGGWIGTPATDLIFRMVVPFGQQRTTVNDFDRVILNWNNYHSGSEESWYPSDMSRSIERNERRVYLTPQQYREMSQTAGNYATRNFEAASGMLSKMKRPIDPAQPSDEAFEVAKQSLEDGRAQAREEIIAKHGLFKKAG
jgi:hypothetical protein